MPLGAAEDLNFLGGGALASRSWRAKSTPEEPMTERLKGSQSGERG